MSNSHQFNIISTSDLFQTTISSKETKMNKRVFSVFCGCGALLLSLVLLAGCQPGTIAAAAPLAQNAGNVYAVAPVDQKLFYAVEPVASGATAALRGNSSNVYAMDPVDRQLFHAVVSAADGPLVSGDDFDYEQAADNSAARWLAMGQYYRAHEMLTRDDFDYEQAADNSAARWLAMGQYYEAHEMLTRDDFNYEQAADNSAARWLAIGRGYERLGMLNG